MPQIIPFLIYPSKWTWFWPDVCHYHGIIFANSVQFRIVRVSRLPIEVGHRSTAVPRSWTIKPVSILIRIIQSNPVRISGIFGGNIDIITYIFYYDQESNVVLGFSKTRSTFCACIHKHFTFFKFQDLGIESEDSLVLSFTYLPAIIWFSNWSWMETNVPPSCAQWFDPPAAVVNSGVI